MGMEDDDDDDDVHGILPYVLVDWIVFGEL